VSNPLTAQGISALQQGQWHDAERMLRAAISADPADAHALHGLAIIGHQTGHLDAALTLYDQALSRDPAFAAAYVNQGNLLHTLGRFDDAIRSHQSAVALAPELVSARINLATTLHAVGRIDEAVESLEFACELNPNAPEAFNNLGNLYKEQGLLADALSAYEKASDLNPFLAEPVSNRVSALKLDVEYSPAALLLEHRRWSGAFEGVLSVAPLFGNTPTLDRKIRIGYVSPDCHTALPAFIDPVIAAHDRGRFEIYCYFNNPQTPESLAKRGIAQTARGIRGASDEDVAKLIHADAIDVLVDIAGHTGRNRLQVFARRPAPIQMTWLDYLATTGLRGMDYRITDMVADPPDAEAFHTETLLRMPHAQWCWRPDSQAPPVSALPATTRGYVTFGSFNNAIKLTDATLALWRGLLEAMPDARLIIAGLAEGVARSRVLAHFGAAGARLTFLPRVSVEKYREAFAEVDIALDPMPFSGATTTLDALWQGVPVLTLPGATSCSRSAASILMSLSLSDWIASNAADWLLRAQRLAADRAALTSLRAGLRERVRVSPLTDVPAFTRALEALYESAWRDWCTKRHAADDNVRAGIVRTELDAEASMRIAQQDLARVVKADGAIDPQALDTATARLIEVIRVRPTWELAKKDFSQAILSWVRFHPEAQPAWRQIVHPAPARTSVSAIVCSIRPDYFAHIKKRLEEIFSQHDFEVIGIHDAKSLCEGYNRGAARAKGELLIFCHDDIEIVHADFGTRVISHLRQYDVIGVAGSSRLVDAHWGHGGAAFQHGQIIHRPPEETALRHEQMRSFTYLAVGMQQPIVEHIQALDGVFIAARRQVWEQNRFDEQTFDGFHTYDIDFTYRAHLAGFRIAIPLDLLLIHFSTGKYDPAWVMFNRRFLAKFPALSNIASVEAFSSCHLKVQSLEQVERLNAGFLHYRFGAVNPERVVRV
jgi:protein O-GlcNAc transferase